MKGIQEIGGGVESGENSFFFGFALQCKSNARGRMMVTRIIIFGENHLIYKACPRYGKLGDVIKELEI